MGKDSQFWDPVRQTTNKPQYEVTLAAPGGGATRGALSVKSVKRNIDGNVEFEIFWHPEKRYRIISNAHLSDIVNLKTKRKITDLAAYYR